MKIKSWFTVITLFCVLNTYAQGHITKLIRNGNYFQFIVDDKPYLIFGGELGNSSASSSEYMRPIWPKLKAMNLNTVIAPVYWELMEPIEGKFDFSLVDSLLKNACLNKMKLVLLWFGTWKNSMSCYAPAWIKTDEKRFPRSEDVNGIKQEIMTPFDRNILESDKRAFVKLMKHIKQTDNKQNTVITVQVENEIGMLPSARTHDEAANKVFEQAVPLQLINYLIKHKGALEPGVRSLWEKNGFKTAGSWEDIFGKGLFTDEIFMAWYYAKYANEIAAAGKAVYDLPMYVNAALNRPGWKPGLYPSGGPIPHVMDIWKAGAPVLDMMAPDIYFPDFEHWANLYDRHELEDREVANPLFIPEIRFEKGDDAKAFFAFGNYNCLSFSPFSIQSTDHPQTEPIGKTYSILQQISNLITTYQPRRQVAGFLLSKDSSTTTDTMANYRVTVKHDYTLGWSAAAKKDTWPLSGCIVIQVAPDEFYVAGTGVVITFQSVVPGKRAGFLRIDEGKFENKKWIAGRRMNGDQDHQGRHVRIPADDYGIQRVKLYQY